MARLLQPASDPTFVDIEAFCPCVAAACEMYRAGMVAAIRGRSHTCSCLATAASARVAPAGITGALGPLGGSCWHRIVPLACSEAGRRLSGKLVFLLKTLCFLKVV